jgi:hypothetical protein
MAEINKLIAMTLLDQVKSVWRSENSGHHAGRTDNFSRWPRIRRDVKIDAPCIACLNVIPTRSISGLKEVEKFLSEIGTQLFLLF